MTIHLEKIDEILAVDDTVRYVAFVDSKGNVIASKIKKNVTDIGENEEEMYMVDLCITKSMLDIFDSSFGKTISLYTTREKTRQLIYYHGNLIIYVSPAHQTRMRKRWQRFQVRWDDWSGRRLLHVKFVA